MRARTPFRLILPFVLALGVACLMGLVSASALAATPELGLVETSEPAGGAVPASLPKTASESAAPPLAAAVVATAGPASTVSNPPLTASLPDVAGSVFRVLGAFVMVMALFLGGVWAWRNWQRLTPRSIRRQDLKVVEFKSLGARQTLWVIAYRKQRLLVASSPAGIALVSPLPEAETEEPAESPAPDFAAAFRHVLGRSA